MATAPPSPAHASITTPRAKRSQRRPVPPSSKRRLPLRVPETSPKPISWPEEFKRALPVGRLIRLDSATPIENVPFFTLLNYDVRREIYDCFLKSRFRQHILCPSVARLGRTKELFSRYTCARTCPNERFASMLACGHWECLNSKEGDGEESDLRLADLVAFMRTSKFAYLEISEYLYRTMVFTFSSIPELRVFVDSTPATMLARVRSVAFIAHTLPQNPQACQRFIKGEYFQTEEDNVIELFGCFPNMERLEINFYPSLILALSNQLREVVKPLSQLTKTTDVLVRVPSMVYSGTSELGLPPMARIEETGHFRVVRPVVQASEAQKYCKAYSYQF